MKIIILEGISTSGKTIVKDMLAKEIKGRNRSCLVIDEEETLLPTLNNKSKGKAIKFLTNILTDIFNADEKYDVIIFDRFYFTHIFRTNSTIKDFNEIEAVLAKYKATIILLTVDQARISGRILEAMEYRDEKWKKYVKNKGDIKEIAQYYTRQQKTLLEFVKDTSLSVITKDTTSMDFDKITNEILQQI